MIVGATAPLGTVGAAAGPADPRPTPYLIGPPTEGLRVGDLAPEFSVQRNDGSTFQLTDLDGQPVRMADLAGRAVWVNFWASWCPPCQAETPILRELDREYRDRGLSIVGISVQETSAADVATYVDRYSLGYTIAADLDGDIFRKYRVLRAADPVLHRPRRPDLVRDPGAPGPRVRPAPDRGDPAEMTELTEFTEIEEVAAPSAAEVDPRIRIGRFWLALIAIGGAFVLAGALLPWVGYGGTGIPTEVRNGFETGGDGFITAALGLLVIGLAVRGRRAARGPTRMSATISLVAGFFILSIPALRWSDFRNSVAIEAIGVYATPEIGLYITALGGLIAIIGAWQLRRLLRPLRREAAPTSAEPPVAEPEQAAPSEPESGA